MLFENIKRLTKNELYGVLCANYYLSSMMPGTIRLAARGCWDLGKTKLHDELMKHAKDEDGHHMWAWEDIENMGRELLPMTKATKELTDWVRGVAKSDKPWHIVALSNVAERVAPALDPKELLPEGEPASYIINHIKADAEHGDDVDEMLNLFTKEELKELEDITPHVTALYEKHMRVGAESGTVRGNESYITQRPNKQHLLTQLPPVIEKVHGTKYEDVYMAPGEPFGINYLCLGGVRGMGYRLEPFKSKKVILYMMPAD